MSAFAAELLQWYDAHRRDLPWRRRHDAYAIWISEVMLQQTRVDTVVPYYRRWLDRYPTVTALAVAPEADVLKTWEGLGYYSRARNLQRAARELTASYGGEVPDDPAAFARLPGVGEYTVGAVMSMAYQRPLPAVDGNVLRVFARLLDDDGDVTRPQVRRRIQGEVVGRLPPDRPGDFNQALMELGALVCTPRRPRCGDCPVVHHCRAAARGRQAELPHKGAKAPPTAVNVVAGVVAEGERFLLARRPPQGLLAGLWEFPGGEVASGEDGPDALRRHLWQGHGLEIAVDAPLTTVQHAFSHRVWHLVAYECHLTVASPRPPDTADRRWVTAGDLAGLALPRAFQQVARALTRYRR